MSQPAASTAVFARNLVMAIVRAQLRGDRAGVETGLREIGHLPEPAAYAALGTLATIALDATSLHRAPGLPRHDARVTWRARSGEVVDQTTSDLHARVARILIARHHRDNELLLEAWAELIHPQAETDAAAIREAWLLLTALAARGYRRAIEREARTHLAPGRRAKPRGRRR